MCDGDGGERLRCNASRQGYLRKLSATRISLTESSSKILPHSSACPSGINVMKTCRGIFRQATGVSFCPVDDLDTSHVPYMRLHLISSANHAWHVDQIFCTGERATETSSCPRSHDFRLEVYESKNQCPHATLNLGGLSEDGTVGTVKHFDLFLNGKGACIVSRPNFSCSSGVKCRLQQQCFGYGCRVFGRLHN